MSIHEKHLIVIGGATASGKTALAIELALRLDCEILSADSRQFYKELSIGTAKPTGEELKMRKHHFIDTLSISENYTAGQFENEALKVLDQLFLKSDFAIVVGGSGLYIDAICKGFDDLPKDASIKAQLVFEFEQKGIESLQHELKEKDPEYYESCDYQNPHRIIRALEIIRSSGEKVSVLHTKAVKNRPFNIYYFAIEHSRELLYDRINKRVIQMIHDGLIEEVKSVLSYRNHQALNTVGYKEVFDYLDGKLSLEETISSIQQNTRRYAKRQLTWFRREKETHWLTDENLTDELYNVLMKRI
jgi:tRNA dimethylallyltransferase